MLSKSSLVQIFLLASIIVYFAQGPFYPTGSVIGKASLLIVLFISILFLIKEFILSRSSKPMILWLAAVLLLLNFLGFLLSLQFSGTHFSQIRNILTALLPLIAFYSLSKSGSLNEKQLFYFFIVLLFIFIASSYHSRATLMLEQDRDNVVSNTAYLFVTLIPFLFIFYEKRIVSFLTLFVLMLFTIQGAKRGAIITGGIGAIFFLVYAFMKTPKDKKLSSYLLLGVGLIILGTSAIHIYETNEFLVRRMEEITDGGSGRDRIYMTLLTAWYNSDSILNYLFGYGFAATIEHSGSGHLAHNDWLELLVNFGLLGVTIYLAIFISLLSLALNKNISSQYRFAISSLAAMWFLQTLFSMYYTSSSSVISMIILGYILGQAQVSQSLE